MTTTYRVDVARDDRQVWMISVPELRSRTYAHNLPEIPHTARNHIATTLGVPASDITVDIHIDYDSARDAAEDF